MYIINPYSIDISIKPKKNSLVTYLKSFYRLQRGKKDDVALFGDLKCIDDNIKKII